MNKIRELIRRLNDKWIDSSEEHYIHVWASLAVIGVGAVLVYMLFSQTERLDVLKKDNITLTHQLNTTISELNSLKAQIEYDAHPVIIQESKPIDIVIQSNAQEIKGKVNEIQKQLIEGSSTPIPNVKPKTSQHSDVRQLNNNLQQTFCKSSPTHEKCKEGL